MPTEDTTSAPAGANWVESVVAGGDELAVAMAIHGILVAPREAVEALARELRWWWRRPVERWSILPKPSGYSLVDWGSPSPCTEWQLGTPETLLLLHLARLGPTRERCKDCEGGRQSMSRGDMSAAITKGEYASVGACARAGWNFDTSVSVGSGNWPGFSRPCPTCAVPVECDHDDRCAFMDIEHPDCPTRCVRCVDSGGKVLTAPTGWLTREHGWAERWLRARPDPSGMGDERPGDPEDPEARADLLVLADQLQDQGDPLGDWLALWLAGKPCEDCNRAGRTVAATYETLAGVQAVMESGNSLEVVGCTSEGGEPFTTKRGGTIIEWAPCSPCHSTGLELGHHTQAMAARGAA